VTAPTRNLTPADVARFVADHVFPQKGGRQVGIELEWVPVARPGVADPTPELLRSVIPSTLPHHSQLTFEPGGQLELSGPPAGNAGRAISDMHDDVKVVRDALDVAGIDLVGIGLDPRGLRRRVVDGPRYCAMEEYFDTRWPAGRTMMRNTAAIQVNVDADSDGDARWTRSHELAAVLAALFANSPFDAHGRATGWRSTRLAVWDAIDRRRTRAAYVNGVDARMAYLRYALDAPTMMIRVDEHSSVAIRDALPFREWMSSGHRLGWPTLDDFEYHLSTLFPPVRPRGRLELRMIDALPDEWWPVAVAIATAMVSQPYTNQAAPWTRLIDAARDGLCDPTMASTATRWFDRAYEALPDVGTDESTIAAAAEFRDRFVARRRSPADELLTNWLRVQRATA
jgi:glutamate--cysteine ligase